MNIASLDEQYAGATLPGLIQHQIKAMSVLTTSLASIATRTTSPRAPSMFQIALPILGVSKSAVAEAFYCGKLGFRRAYAYRPDPERSDPCWLGVVRDGAHLVLSSFGGDGPPGSRNVQIYVEDAAALRRELREAGVEGLDDLVEQTWGNLEFHLVDPDGNRINIAQDRSG